LIILGKGSAPHNDKTNMHENDRRVISFNQKMVKQ